MKEQLRRHYARMLHKIVDGADVVLPCLTRATRPGLQPAGREGAQVRGEGQKRLVFMLNKIGAWPSACPFSLSNYLDRPGAARECPGIAEATPPHDLNAALPLRGLAPAHAHLLRHCTGVLLRLLKVYNPSAAQSIAISVIGLPNVGESSQINTLKRAVAAQPGHTKELKICSARACAADRRHSRCHL